MRYFVPMTTRMNQLSVRDSLFVSEVVLPSLI
jgi:hypothetical protein